MLQLERARKGHVLVYLTSGFETFVEMPGTYPEEQFIVYGQGERSSMGNLTFKPPSKEGFLKDLADCKAVMATAGFTLITESLHLKKPYYIGWTS